MIGSAFGKERQEELLHMVQGEKCFLNEEITRGLLRESGLGVADLCCALLPVAQKLAATIISNYPVGAIIAGCRAHSNEPCLAFGANVEFGELDLGLTIHAEQASMVIACSNSMEKPLLMAISSVPCGFCRQFLNEFGLGDGFQMLLPNPGSGGYANTSISKLLPNAFGPRDLGIHADALNPMRERPELKIHGRTPDDLVTKALVAAMQSYAPYSLNYSGCAVLTQDGRIFACGYLENAAYNPSLAPMHATLAACILSTQDKVNLRLSRAVLVEHRTKVSQVGISKNLVSFTSKGTKLEYFTCERLTTDFENSRSRPL